jgi:hypothetical protein
LEYCWKLIAKTLLLHRKHINLPGVLENLRKVQQ